MQGAVYPGYTTEVPDEEEVQDSEEEDDDADEMDDMEFLNRDAKYKRGCRASVIAEAWQKDPHWQCPQYPKTPEQRNRILNAISNNFLFSVLTEETVEQLIGAFKEHHVAPGCHIITEGEEVLPDDPGLFVFESGFLEVFKSQAYGQPPIKVLNYDSEGQSFGELALLYNCPRQATVIALIQSVLWSIDRTTFNELVKGHSVMEKKKYEAFLNRVHILQSLNDLERAKIADVLRPMKFQQGQVIFREGDEGSDFFLIQEGRVLVMKDGCPMNEHGEGDYFGERALLIKEPRAAEIQALTNVKLLALDRLSFHRLLGPLSAILRERMALYG